MFLKDSGICVENGLKHLRVETGKTIKRMLQVMRNDDNLAELEEAEIF